MACSNRTYYNIDNSVYSSVVNLLRDSGDA